MVARRQVVITKSGGPEVLQIQSSDLPAPGQGEVTVEVAAASINFADILARQGLYPDAPPLPCTVGYDVSGTVTEMGAGVDSSWQGKRVYGLTRFGGYSSHLNIPINQLFDIPEKLSFEEAASLPVVYLTAYQLVLVMGQLKADETILIQNAGGGVGLAILDLARRIGAKTIGTASKGKHEFLLERGLDQAIDYTSQNVLQEVKRLTDGRGVGQQLARQLESLRSTGRLGMFGVSEASHNGFIGKLKLLRTALQMPFFHPVGLMNDNKGAFGVNMGHLWHEVDKIRSWMEDLDQAFEDGWIRPFVDKTFSFEQAGEAHQYIEDRKSRGKVLLIP